jgi:ribosomal protein S18 acetylase RimI-like enzyme
MNIQTDAIASDTIRVVLADYKNPSHAAALVAMLDIYARDPMGGGKGLSAFAKANVVAQLAARPHAYSVLAFDGTTDEAPVGLVNCIEGFSTFACRPLVNVHDVAVKEAYRGLRVGARMLELAQAIAKERGACKLTLEVLSNNAPARQLYQRIGFSDYQLDPDMGSAGLMQKWLD